MAIDFKSFISDIKKGAGAAKRKYSDTVSSVQEYGKEREAAKQSETRQKDLYKQLIDKTSKKAFVKEHGEKAYNMAMDKDAGYNPSQKKYKKSRAAMEEKYKGLK